MMIQRVSESVTKTMIKASVSKRMRVMHRDQCIDRENSKDLQISRELSVLELDRTHPINNTAVWAIY